MQLLWRTCRTATLLAIVAQAASLAATPRMSAATLARPPAPSAAIPTLADGSLLEAFTASFRGHFDNHAQVVEDRAADLLPRHGGGHEHIHCHVQPVAALSSSEHFALASYYFDADPTKLFRERLYGARELTCDPQFGHCIQMRIFQLRGATEEALRAGGGDAAAVDWTGVDAASELVLPGCDVFWRRVGERFEGRMRTESVEVHSARMGMPIVVRDDVALFDDGLWVNDRGTDIDGNYLYGNVRDVPYKMDRLA